MTSYQIDKQDALWLSRAAGNVRYSPSLALVNVATNQFGHVAATTDGHRLHVVEVDPEIPDGLYTVDKKAGTLTLYDNTDKLRYPEWCQIVPKSFNAHTDKLPLAIEEQSGFRYILQPMQVKIDKKYMDQAIPPKTTIKISMNTPTRPILIKITSKKNNQSQFAVIMPTL